MKRIEYVIMLAIAFTMFLLAEITGNREIAVIDIVPLAYGMLAAEKQPWKTDKLHTIILTILAAVGGMVIQKYIPVPIYFKLVIAFVYMSVIMMILNCTLMQAFASCMMPIFLGFTSMKYALSLIAFAIIICIIQTLLINTGKKESPVKFRYLPDFERDAKLWMTMVIVFAVAEIYPAWFGKISLISTPIVVIFVDGCYRGFAGKQVKVWFLLVVAAVTGSLVNLIFHNFIGIPVCICVLFALGITMLEMHLMSMQYAPICSVTLAPFMTNTNIMHYPVMLAIGGLVMITAASIIHRNICGSDVVQGKHTAGRRVKRAAKH